MCERSAGVFIAFLFLLGFIRADDEAIFRNFNLKFGQLFSIPAESTKDDILFDTFPSWLAYNGSYIFGVPQLDSALKEKEISPIQFHIGANSWVNVDFNLKDENPCGYDATLFFEVYKDKSYNEYSPKELNEEIEDFAATMDVDVSEFRVFRADYLNIWRAEENEVFSNIEPHNIRNDQLVVVWKLGCGSIDDNEDYINIVSVVSDNKFKYRLIQAFVNNVNIREFTQATEVRPVTEPPVMRTTRQSDRPPVRVKSFHTYYCIKGKICSLRIPNDIFVDDLDSNLKYSVHSISNRQNFLEAEEGTNIMKGIALEAGNFQFRLDARDRSNQVASAPFNVDVKDEQKSNYYLEFTIDRLFSNFNGVARCNFMEKIASVLKLKSENLRIDSVSEGAGHRQTAIKLHSLDHYQDEVCNQEKIQSLFKQLATTSGNARISFAKQMGSIYHVRRVKLQLYGQCGTSTEDDSIEIKDLKKPDTTQMTNIQATEGDSLFYQIHILFFIAGLVSIVLVLLIIYCCKFRKSRSKKQKKSLEYVTRGNPVVFPNERNRNDDTPSVTTPMLIKDERPPLQPQLEGTTIHENPLYKAPSVGRTSVSTDNTNLNTAGASRLTGTPNQRLPPPYVAP